MVPKLLILTTLLRPEVAEFSDLMLMIILEISLRAFFISNSQMDSIHSKKDIK